LPCERGTSPRRLDGDAQGHADQRLDVPADLIGLAGAVALARRCAGVELDLERHVVERA
jgi:hypothetical protein